MYIGKDSHTAHHIVGKRVCHQREASEPLL